MLDDLDLSAIQDPAARQIIQRLLAIIEQQATEIRALRQQVQRLEDENRRLKGGSPRPPTPPAPRETRDISSERQRQQPAARVKRGKRDIIPVDREEVRRVDPALLPADAEFKGYEDVVTYDLILRTDHVLFHKEKWYAASTGRTYLADLPPGYDGTFGPGLKTLVYSLTGLGNIAAPPLLALCAAAGCPVSAGTLATWLAHPPAVFQTEVSAVLQASCASAPFQHIDDTVTRINGVLHHCHTLTSPVATSYQTCPRKDRQTVLDVLTGQRPRQFLLDAQALMLARALGLSGAAITRLTAHTQLGVLDEATLTALLQDAALHLGPKQRQWVLDAARISAYWQDETWPVVPLLVGDDAGQWRHVTADFAGCWVHDGRHYAVLAPVVAHHRRLVERFQERYWRYYHTLRAYQRDPTPDQRVKLARRFDRLFATTTGYGALDDRIAKTRAKKHDLLRVLDHPYLPLHNNPAELAVRQRVRKRDVSFGPRTAAGAQAWDVLQSLVATTRQLGVSFLTYVRDRLLGLGEIPPLADLVRQRAQELWPAV